MTEEQGSLSHLMGRFVWSLRRGGPDPTDEAWLLSLCTEREQQLYRVSSRQDRRHAVECGRRAQALLRNPGQNGQSVASSDGAPLGPEATQRVIVAAALHDVGKTPARLSTLGRVAATIVRPFVTERSEFASRTSWWGRFGIYKAHPRIGAELLAAAGSDQLVIDWAEQHHLAGAERTIEPSVAALLERAD